MIWAYIKAAVSLGSLSYFYRYVLPIAKFFFAKAEYVRFKLF